MPVLRRQRQVDLCEFEASSVYRENSRAARATQRNPVCGWEWGQLQAGLGYVTRLSKKK